MSAGIAVNRPPPSGSLPLFKHNEEMQIQSPSKVVGMVQSQGTQVQTPLAESDLEQRLRLALRERDEEWRKHEKEQIVFLQTESANMLKGLHSEIERLGHHLRDAKRQIFVTGKEDHLETEKLLAQQEKRIDELEKLIHVKEEQAEKIERKVSRTMEKLQEQITIQADRIRQLTGELNDRNQSVAHLSSQLRSYRLRDAMATAQQRRRASSQGGSPPLVSPTSPQRVFPPKGLVSASVTVSYPGGSLVPTDFSGEGPGSIEKPMRRRLSGGGSFGK